MRITEADYEYLLHTLSEARSRATELAVSISARVGTDHRLAELANAAASKVEGLLREVRRAATGESDNGAKVYELAVAPPAPIQPEPSPAPEPSEAPARKPPAREPATNALPWASFTAEAGLGPEHWLSRYVEELMEHVRATGAITFETAEQMLQHHKDAFQRDIETARRMVRLYPQLFREASSQPGASLPPASPKMLSAQV